MARFVATDYSISINGTDVSDSVAAVTLDITSESQDVTSFGSGGYRSRIGGLKDASLTLDFHQDFGAGGIDDLTFPLIGTGATVVILPTSEAVSATNPSYTGVFQVESYSPFASSIGDLATLSVTWSLGGTAGITRGTA